MEAASFLRELVAYYTLLESSSAVSLAAASEPPKDSYISLLSLDTHNDRASSVTGASGYCIPIDSHSFTNGLGTPCTLYGTMVIIMFLFIMFLATSSSSVVLVICGIIIPAKAWEYVFTGVGLCVCVMRRFLGGKGKTRFMFRYDQDRDMEVNRRLFTKTGDCLQNSFFRKFGTSGLQNNRWKVLSV